MIELAEAEVAVPSQDPAAPPITLVGPLSLALSEPRISVIGPNGSGKSTCLRLLAGLVPASSGRVLVEGHDPATERAQVRSRVGFIFTDPLSQLVMPTAIEDVELSLRKIVRSRAERRQRAQQLLDARGLGHLAHRSIYDLSGGERQMVALATVLAVEPRILVADEPTTLLDLRNTVRLRAELSQLSQQVIFSTHNLEVARDAQRTLLVDRGGVVADGAPDEVIARYRAMMAG